MNIAYKLALAFLSASLLPLGIAATFSYLSARDLLEDQVKDHLQSLGAIQQSRLEALLDRNRERLRLVASRIELRLNLAKLQETGQEPYRQVVIKSLREAKAFSGEFRTLSVVGADGRIVAATTPALVGSRQTLPAQARSESGSVDLLVKTPVANLITRLAGPILSGDRYLGTLVIEANSGPMLAILGDYTGLGQTGETTLAKKNPSGKGGIFISSRSGQGGTRALTVMDEDSADTHPIQVALAGQQRFLADAVDHRGEHVLAATRYLPGPKWALVVKIDRDEAFGPIARLRNLLLGTIFIAALIGTFTCVVLAQAFSGPIGALTRAARKISAGEQPRRLDIQLERVPGPFAAATARVQKWLDARHRALASRIEAQVRGMTPVEGSGSSPISLGRAIGLASLISAAMTTSAAARAVASLGRFEIDVRSRDEIGYLVEAFNRMAESVNAMRSELETKIEELTSSNAELERFAYVASHDLQEPLRMISSYVQLLDQRSGDRLDPEAREFVGFAVDGANRMQAMIQDLLEYSRVGTRGAPLEPVDSAAALEVALNNLQQVVREKNARIVTEPLPIVLADRAQLTRVFQNLLSNALKFTRPDTPPQVSVAAVSQDGEWAFSVADNGIGIDPKYSARIFEVFQRLHPHGRYPGTGIGLAICKRIIERHGGHIWVESRLGAGTTFRFTLPAAVHGGQESATSDRLRQEVEV